MHESLPPYRDSEHDLPARRCNRLLSVNSQFDFIEFVLDPFAVRAIVVQFLKYPQSVVCTIDLDQVPR